MWNANRLELEGNATNGPICLYKLDHTRWYYR